MKERKRKDLTQRKTKIFCFDSNETEARWFAVNDVVMGGISKSAATLDVEQRLVFSGFVSLENNGGFASIKSARNHYDLSGCDGIILRVRGDGKIYRFRARTERTESQIAYTSWFETKPETWQEIYLPFSKMAPIYRGKVVDDAEAIDLRSIQSFGLMVAEKQEGPFLLEVDFIAAVSLTG